MTNIDYNLNDEVVKIKNCLKEGFVDIGGVRIDNKMDINTIKELNKRFPEHAFFKCYGINNVKYISDIKGYNHTVNVGIYSYLYEFIVSLGVREGVIEHICLSSMSNKIKEEFKDIIGDYVWGKIRFWYDNYQGINYLYIDYTNTLNNFLQHMAKANSRNDLWNDYEFTLISNDLRDDEVSAMSKYLNLVEGEKVILFPLKDWETQILPEGEDYWLENVPRNFDLKGLSTREHLIKLLKDFFGTSDVEVNRVRVDINGYYACIEEEYIIKYDSKIYLLSFQGHD